MSEQAPDEIAPVEPDVSEEDLEFMSGGATGTWRGCATPMTRHDGSCFG